MLNLPSGSQIDIETNLDEPEAAALAQLATRKLDGSERK